MPKNLKMKLNLDNKFVCVTMELYPSANTSNYTVFLRTGLKKNYNKRQKWSKIDLETS